MKPARPFRATHWLAVALVLGVGGVLLWLRAAREPRYNGHRISHYFPAWKPAGTNALPRFPVERADPEAVVGLVWVLGQPDGPLAAPYRRLYLRAPLGTRRWLPWLRPAMERAQNAFSVLQLHADLPGIVPALLAEFERVSPDWLPNVARLLAERGCEAEVTERLERMKAGLDSARRNAAQAALDSLKANRGVVSHPGRGG